MNYCHIVRVICIVLLCLFSARSSMSQTGGEQSFSVDDGMGVTVQIPKRVMQLLQAQPLVKEYLANPDNDKQSMLDSFEAAAVDLAKHGKTDFVVTNSVFNGANTGPFWVFLKTNQGYKLVLFVTSLDLTIMKSRTKGLRNISAGTATAMSSNVDVYKFTGKKYRFAFSKKTN